MKIGEAKMNMMKKVVLVAFGMIHIDGEKS
jgi:hypothetical protein